MGMFLKGTGNSACKGNRVNDPWTHRQEPFMVPKLLASQSQQLYHAPSWKDAALVTVLYLSHSVFWGLGSAERVGATNVFEHFYF